VATVTSACIDEVNKQVIVGTDCGHLLTEPMTDEQLAEYKAYPEAYFGKIMPVSKKVTTPYELFEFWLESHKHLSREQLLTQLVTHPDIKALQAMSTEDLRVEYAEVMVAALQQSGFKLN
jgi:hypothetical protein